MAVCYTCTLILFIILVSIEVDMSIQCGYKGTIEHVTIISADSSKLYCQHVN